MAQLPLMLQEPSGIGEAIVEQLGMIGLTIAQAYAQKIQGLPIQQPQTPYVSTPIEYDVGRGYEPVTPEIPWIYIAGGIVVLFLAIKMM